MLVKNYFENPDILHIGTKTPRAYYIPYATEKAAKSAKPDARSGSDRFFDLCGGWSFRYYENVRTLRDAFWQPEFDRGGFAPVQVPAVWQNYGVGTPAGSDRRDYGHYADRGGWKCVHSRCLDLCRSGDSGRRRAPQYRLDEEEFTFTLHLKPIL